MADDTARNNEAEITLGLLSAVEQSSAVTQRGVALQLGIALGLVNAYLKRCVNKGYVKIKQVPPNRYAYYLTPKGFVEKSRLTAQYLAISFNFFRDARRQYSALFEKCARRGFSRVALVGEGDLAEIAVLSAAETPLNVVCVIDRAAGRRYCAGRPVVPDIAAARSLAGKGNSLDAVVVTDVRAPQESFARLLRAAAEAGLGPDRVLAPALLRISRQPAGARRKGADT